MIWSPQQQQVLQYYEQGKNIFMTGPGGSGKTELIKHIVDVSSGKNIQVCALTGCAAVLLQSEASTLHSWAGIGLANGSINDVLHRVLCNKTRRNNWIKTDILIIDEISMMSLKLFTILDILGKKIKKEPNKPFGGIQVIFSGDFYQLPPIGSPEDPDSMAFCFESKQWNTTFDKQIQLETIFRQTDPTYAKILNQIRIGKLFKSSYRILLERVGIECKGEVVIPTILHPKRQTVNAINTKEMAKLEGPEHVFERIVVSKKSGAQIDREVNYITSNMMAEKTLKLKIGCQVMCIANLEMEGPCAIINGSQGIIVGFQNEFPIVKFRDGQQRVIGYHIWPSENITGLSIKQIPLIYAWAITIHKAQGTSLDLAQIDIGNNVFECGQTYVALSRIKSLNGLFITAFNPQKIKCNIKVQEFYKGLIVKTFEG